VPPPLLGVVRPKGVSLVHGPGRRFPSTAVSPLFPPCMWRRLAVSFRSRLSEVSFSLPTRRKALPAFTVLGEVNFGLSSAGVRPFLLRRQVNSPLRSAPSVGSRRHVNCFFNVAGYCFGPYSPLQEFFPALSWGCSLLSERRSGFFLLRVPGKRTASFLVRIILSFTK